MLAAAAVLVVTIITITLVMQPANEAVLRTNNTPIAHFNEAMDAIVSQQDELCGQLKSLQV